MQPESSSRPQTPKPVAAHWTDDFAEDFSEMVSTLGYLTGGQDLPEASAVVSRAKSDLQKAVAEVVAGAKTVHLKSKELAQDVVSRLKSRGGAGWEAVKQVLKSHDKGVVEHVHKLLEKLEKSPGNWRLGSKEEEAAQEEVLKKRRQQGIDIKDEI